MKKNNRRLLGISFFTLTLFCFIIIQFYKLQIVEGKKWSKQAKAQHQFSVVEPYRRGRFFANNVLKEKHPKQEDPIVFDVKRYHLYADPIAIPQEAREEIIEKVSELLAIQDKKWVGEQLEKKSRSRRLKMWLSEVDKKLLNTWWRPFARWKKIPSNALYFQEDYKRAYPYGKLLGPVLHTVRDDRDPKTRQAIPTGGLELKFDAELRGKKGKRLRLRSPRHTLEEGLLVDPSEDGADVYLTIDRYIQAIAEEEIERAVKEAGAKSGWAVMMNPHTGEIYALAQYPFFDPSNYRTYYNDPEKTKATKIGAITDCFEPGSTMKPISVAIGMLANKELERQGKETIFDPVAVIPTHDGMFPGRKQPIRDTRRHEYLNMYLAIQKSSNIYVAKLIQRVIATLGDQWYRDQLAGVFGFGKATGIELPSETAGLLPSLDKHYGNGRPQWSIPTPYSLSFGYNLLVTSMQLLRAYALLCNGGYEVQPTLVKKIVKGGEVIFDHSNEECKQVFDPEISREIIYALKSVTKLGGGGFRADIPGYTQAGKTGTTEKIVHGTYSKKHHYSSFIGFTPAFEPKFLLYVAIDEPEYRYLPGIGATYFGGRCAAPVFRQIMQKTYRYLGIPPDDPDNTDWAEEIEILESLYRKYN
ncbi:penicillin-binding transpeptidase domain-containing protein [Candidatus Neptunochlamydia vexilliferae]|uniref:Peptidoglycan synthase FtsI n=1 Tax=Candidatus Neptunichlamydia vexilliferae TaxID=1651774 RepID=A0ABS0B084_9BACT|nr:penicillin-binding protein 2 [Candidatus Neptunochlamydia vexilliferae]MBF5059798.1 Peptidoglycan synthase FtsI [Candidatus Neptunochlamydia vexilliferae]